MNTKNIKLTEHAIAYIDILGATEMIYEDKDNNLIKIHEIYTKAFKRYEKLPDVKKENLKIKIFSDNILISYEICHENSATDDEYRNAIGNVLSFVSSLYWTFSEEAILIRGGMTVGKLFHDGMLVWGEGLVRAHDLESNIAKYPRIVIDLILLEKIRHKNYFLDPLELFISCSDDGVSYFNWLHKLYESEDEYSSKIEQVKSKFEEKLEQYKSKENRKPNVIRKHEWHLSYITDSIKSRQDDLKEIAENPMRID